MKRISHPCNQYMNHASSARLRSIVPLYDLEIRVKCGLFFIKTVSTVFLLRFIIDILNVNVFGFWFDENDIELINDNDHPVRLKNQNYQNSSWCWIKRTMRTYCKIAIINQNCTSVNGPFCFSHDLKQPSRSSMIVGGSFIGRASPNDLKRPKNDLLMTFNWFIMTKLSVHNLLTK